MKDNEAGQVIELNSETQDSSKDNTISAQPLQLANQSKPSTTPGRTPHPIEATIYTYIENLRDIAQTANIVLPHLSEWFLEEYKKNKKQIERFLPATTDDGTVKIESAREYAELTSAVRRHDELMKSKALPVLMRSLFVQIFCEFDAFVGALLKATYRKNDALLRGIAREISLAELLEFSDLDAAKRSMLDKEIETFRRDSYVEQFGQLEKKFGLTLRKFPEWAQFVELSQRRNILAHNDGMVSDQYITVCEREGYKFNPKPPIGETLHIDVDYLSLALQLMAKVGYMLGHTLWAKIFPQESDALHISLDSNIYSCLLNKRWRTAAILADFSLTEPMKKNLSEKDYKVRVINKCIALKFSDNQDESKRILASIDWSASYRDFKLALAILDDRYDDAVKIMKSIGKSGEILNQASYHEWPLFHEFRTREDFYNTYEEIYGEPYAANLTQTNSSSSLSSDAKQQEALNGASPDCAEAKKKRRPRKKKQETIHQDS